MRRDYNWSLLDHAQLCDMLYPIGREFVGRKLPINRFHSIISQHIKSLLPVSIKKQQYDVTQDRGFPYMGGAYDSVLDKRGKQRFIEVVLSYHPKDTEVRITEYRWRRICSLFADTILHEVIHMRQYRSRNFKDIPGYCSTAELRKQRADQEYYGHRDEMGAHSFNIACEMVYKLGSNPRVIAEYMDTIPRRHKKSTFNKFLKAFDYDHNHYKVRQMKRKVLKQLEYAVIGRPFKTTTHLTY